MDEIYKLVMYRMVTGKEPYLLWLEGLRDEKTKGILRRRLGRMVLGSLGSVRGVGGGVFELKIDFGPGYRIYFSFLSKETVVILMGGSKGSQAQDILTAQFYKEDYLRRLS